ncbi:hypothetical protein L7F22_054103 [Adiantum nelumboides]|nr:hypothetical protein [Adiantum nelumboides]
MQLVAVEAAATGVEIIVIGVLYAILCLISAHMVGAHATKPYVLRLNITLRYTSALVIYRPTRRCTASASSQEREFKQSLVGTGESPRTEIVARRIGNILAERLALKGVNKVHLNLEKEALKQERDARRFKALVSGIQEKGIEIVP